MKKQLIIFTIMLTIAVIEKSRAWGKSQQIQVEICGLGSTIYGYGCTCTSGSDSCQPNACPPPPRDC